jgi:hypothetical protein
VTDEVAPISSVGHPVGHDESVSTSLEVRRAEDGVPAWQHPGQRRSASSRRWRRKWTPDRRAPGPGPLSVEVVVRLPWDFGAAEGLLSVPVIRAWVGLANPTAVAITVAGVTVSPPVTPDVPYHLEFQ